MRKMIILIVVLSMSMIFVAPIHAQDQITYISQPESVAIFLNNIALARDTITLAGNADVAIVLPNQVFQDTLIVRENGQRVSQYRMNRDASGQVVLQLKTTSEVSEIKLEYLFAGLGWQPTYDMWIAGEADDESVQMDLFVGIQNSALRLENVTVQLVAGRVDTTQQLDSVSTVTTNQYIAGYDESVVQQPGGVVGPVTIQHVYDAGQISAEIGDTVYVGLLGATFPARRLILWNAQTDIQAQVIYKVTNNSTLPLAEGIVRTYQGDLFIGSDFIEVTPIGSEGSVTVGGVQDVRVSRAESVSQLENVQDYFDTLHEVTLSLSSYSDQAVEVEVVERWNPGAKDFVFSEEPRRDAGNLLRWVITIQPGETIKIEYEFKTE